MLMISLSITTSHTLLWVEERGADIETFWVVLSEYDLLLIKLNSSIDFNEKRNGFPLLNSVCLPDVNSVSSEDYGLYTAWGQRDDSQPNSTTSLQIGWGVIIVSTLMTWNSYGKELITISLDPKSRALQSPVICKVIFDSIDIVIIELLWREISADL